MQQAHFYEMDGGPSGIWWEAVINEVKFTSIVFEEK